MYKSKWLSFILVLTIFFLSLTPPLSLAASKNNSSDPSAQTSSTPLPKKVTRVTELIDKRDQHTKTYLNSDGSYTAETSFTSRHYKDAEGKWQDISNKIESSSADKTFAFRSQANPFQPQFAKDSQAAFLAELKLDKNSALAWSMDNALKSTALNDTNSVTFPDILKSTDLQYQPFSDGLKENIILKDAKAPASFSFQLTLTGLTPNPQDDGSFALKDTKGGDTKYVIPRSYMYDHNQQTSQAVTTDVTPTKSQRLYSNPNP